MPGEGVREFTFGRHRVTALSDRRGRVPADGQLGLFVGALPEELRALLPDGGVENAVNAFLIRRDDRVVLVDAGVGAPAGGNVRARLAAAGVAPDQVTDVLMTHLHGDHAGGLHEDGRAVFPNATLWLAQAEADYWNDDAARDALPEGRRGGFAGARAALAAMAGRTRTFAFVHPENPGNFAPGLPEDAAVRGNAELGAQGFPFSVVAVSLAGHTPGHTGYGLPAEDGRALLFWGDVVHRVDVQAPRPDVSVTYDVDPDKAAKTRREFLELQDATREVNIEVVVAGAHLPFQGVGAFTKARDGKGYVYAPWPGGRDAAPPGEGR